MKTYIIDTNLLSKEVLSLSQVRSDLMILEEILYEKTQGDSVEEQSIRNSSLKVVKLETHHYKKMVEVLSECGDRQDFLSLWLNEGVADVAIVAYILAERERLASTLPGVGEEFIIVTNDIGLTEVAADYGIHVQKSLRETIN